MKNANLVSVLLRVAVWAGCLSLTAGCGRSDAIQQTTPKAATEFFAIPVGEKVVRLQLAVRTHEMERGLMERRDLKPDEGMIFIYAGTQKMNFWMRNTPTPLDIGFFTADGVLREVYPLNPYDETTVSSRSSELKFAVEMNQGWFARNAVKPGAKLDLKALAEAMRARGFEARDYGVR